MNTKSIADTRYMSPAQVKTGSAKNSPSPSWEPGNELRTTGA